MWVKKESERVRTRESVRVRDRDTSMYTTNFSSSSNNNSKEEDHQKSCSPDKPHLIVGTQLVPSDNNNSSSNNDTDVFEGSPVVKNRSDTIHDILPTPTTSSTQSNPILHDIGNKIYIPKRKTTGSGASSNPFASSISPSSNVNTAQKRMMSILDIKPNNSGTSVNSGVYNIIDHPTVNDFNQTSLQRRNRIVSDIDSSSLAYQNNKRIVSLPIQAQSDTHNVLRQSKNYNLEKSSGTVQSNTSNNYTDQGREFETLEYVKGYFLLGLKETREVGFKKIRKIGEGNFSEVFLYSLEEEEEEEEEEGDGNSNEEGLKSSSYMACKHIKYPRELTKYDPQSTNYKNIISKLESSLIRELNVLNKLNYINGNDNVIQLTGLNDLKLLDNKRPLTTGSTNGTNSLPDCYIFTTYCKSGDLLNFAKQNNGKMDINMIYCIFQQIVTGVKFLHDNLIIHRDLKLENVLLTLDFDELRDYLLRGDNDKVPSDLVKIADFGLCKEIYEGEMCSTRCGSEDYVAPEILMGLEYDGRLTDCWALGVILYCLLESKLPFDPAAGSSSSKKNRPVSYRIVRCDWKWNLMKHIDVQDEQDTKMFDVCKRIVENCLIRRTNRWNINTIYESFSI